MSARLSLTLALLLGLADQLPAQALPGQIERATPELLERVAQSMGQKAEFKNDKLQVTLDKRTLYVGTLDGGTRVMVHAQLSAKANLEGVNRYNDKKAILARAVLDEKGVAHLEAGLDCRFGLTERGLAAFLANFARDCGEAEQVLNEPQRAGATLFQVLNPEETELEVHFPTAGKSETAWRIVWDMQTAAQANQEGLKFSASRNNSNLIFKIKKAFFRPGADAPWVQVLQDAHPQEFYVPYLGFRGTYFFDLKDVGSYTALSDKDAGPRGKLIGKKKMVVAELRERGLVYKHNASIRRGEAFAMWASFGAGNYTYFVEYVFQDDGTIIFKHAPTGYNYYDHFDKAAHMHHCLWRIGVRLTPTNVEEQPTNEVRVVKLRYDSKTEGLSGEVNFLELKSESAIDIDPREYTHLRVTNPDRTLLPPDLKRPERRLPISYDLIPLMQGVPRHLRAHERFSEHDFYVTRCDSPATMYINMHKYFDGKQPPSTLSGSDGVVLWHTSSALHIPRSEDGIYLGNNVANGQAQVSWTTLELRPRNLFLKTPLYGGK